MAKIFVIAGHGAGDPGACGNGFSEAERVRALANKIKELGGNDVILGDVSRDYYADNGISSLNISKDVQIIELHMDAGISTARGGHVIINANFTADNYDNALANMLAKLLPGRANMIVARNDLSNLNRAAVKGYGYRLVEFGFITNASDVNIFNTKMDEIARGVINAFGIKTVANNKTTGKKIGENKTMGILSVKGTTTQYYFDGKSVHPFTNGEEKKVIKKVCKEIEDIELTSNEFKMLKEILRR